jgi:large subunit ribosomal protein L30
MLAVVRIRESAEKRKKVEDTLTMLRLDAINNCVVVPETADYKGMVEKVKDVVTWGEIDKEMLVDMLKKRMRLKGEKRIDENNLKSITGHSSYESFAEAMLEGKIKLKDFDQLQPMFRLTPPSKGFKSAKENYPRGDLGYRGKEINGLIARMI